jgi:hypothetical protein
MKRYLTVLITTLSMATAAESLNTRNWVNNDHNLPSVISHNNSQGFVLISNCEKPIINFYDTSMKEVDMPFRVSGKIRIDTNAVRSFEADFTWSEGRFARLSMTIDPEFVNQLKKGHTLRVQWPSNVGGSIVEEYNLKGFTETYTRFKSSCNTWFEPLQAGKDYFS